MDSVALWLIFGRSTGQRPIPGDTPDANGRLLDDFPEVAGRWMDERGMSVRALARAVHNDPSYVSRVLRGIKPAGPDIARRIDEALGAGGEITAAVSRPAAPVAQEEHVAPELADYFTLQLAGHYQADRYLGPGRLIRVATDQDELLADVAGSATGPLRAGLWGIAAGYAALLGWLHQDAGNLSMSARWHDTMIERAHRTSDDHLIAFSLHCKAMLLGDQSDGRGVLDLTSAALRNRPRLAPKVQVLLLQQHAHGLALTGGDGAAAECFALLDDAAALLDLADDGRPWGGQVRTPGYLDIQRATICTRLGLAAQALALWNEVIPAMSPGRDLGVFLARQAQALAVAGEPERAAEVAQSSAALASSTGSARMRTELMTLRERMKPWRRERPGRALDAALAAIPPRKGK